MLWKISMGQRLKKCGTIYNHTFGFALNTGQNGPEKKSNVGQGQKSLISARA